MKLHRSIRISQSGCILLKGLGNGCQQGFESKFRAVGVEVRVVPLRPIRRLLLYAAHYRSLAHYRSVKAGARATTCGQD